MTTISKNVNQGDSVSIQATPKTGYTFSGWTSGEGDSRISTDNPYTFTPNADTTINAVFSEATPVLTITATGNGQLRLTNSQGNSTYISYSNGTKKYYGEIENYGASDIVSIYYNNPSASTTIYENTTITGINLSGITNTNFTIYQRSFAYCTALTTVVLPSTSYSIASINGSQSNHAGAFQGCTALSSLTLGGCTSIGAYAFYGCSALRTVNIPGSCTTIGSDAFYNAGIATLTMAEGIQNIGDYAFVNNYRMTSVSFPSTLSSYGKGAFSGCYGLATITMNNYSGTYYATSGNCLYEISSHSVVLGCKTSTIPTSSWNVNKIFDSAFNEMIKSGANVNLTIPSNITSIGESAFYGCDGLTGVSFSGSGLTTLMSYSFYGCTDLTTITLPSSFSYFGTSSSSTGTYCFGGCTNLATVYMNSISTPPTIYRGVGTNTVSISLFPSTIQKIYIKSGTMSSYQADTNGWDYWYNQKKLYIGLSIATASDPVDSSTVSTSSNNVELQSDSAAPTVILTATPTTGYTFSSWNRGSTVLSTSNPYTATVVDDGTGTDEFTAISTVSSYSISASVNPSGGGTISGTGSYSYGDSCTVSATSNTGYDFVNWTEGGNTVSTSASYTFTVSSARTLVANFELQTITISAGPNTSGYGTVSGTGSYNYGDTVSLTATAASGYEFSEWTENGTTVSSNSTYSFTATQDRTLVAVFIVSMTEITITTTGADTVYLKNSSDSVYTWNLTSGTNTYDGSESGFELNNLKSIYKYTAASGVSTTNTITGIDISSSSITSLDQYAFYRCAGLTSITLPNSLTTIGNGALRNTGLTSITLPNSLTTIADSAFQSCTSLTSISLSNSLTSIGQYAFQSCTSLTSITFPNSLTTILYSAFNGCTSLTSITFPNSLTTIGSEAFLGCTNLSSITLTDNITSIYRSSFSGTAWWSNQEDTIVYSSNICFGYKTTKPTGAITITSNTKTIAGSAFYNCTGLTSITCMAITPPSIINNSFNKTSNCPIYVPSDSVNDYKSSWSTYSSRIQAIPS